MCGRFTDTFEFSDIRVRWEPGQLEPYYDWAGLLANDASANQRSSGIRHVIQRRHTVA
jgi:hypothetical protein